MGKRKDKKIITVSHKICSLTGPQIRVHNRSLIFLFLNQNICCGYSKEPSRRDSSFENPKHVFKMMGKKIIAILCKKIVRYSGPVS